jgi:hypothetical protein
MSDRGGRVFVKPRREVDDWDKEPSFDAGETRVAQARSLDALELDPKNL